MILRRFLYPITLTATLLLASCGGDDEADSISQPTTAESTAPSTTAAAATETPDETTGATGGADSATSAELEDCGSWITAEEIDAILGTTVEVTGSTKTCNMTFRDDAVGTFQALEGAKKDQGIEELITPFAADPSDGVLLDGDRGFVTLERAVVLGSSDVLFLFNMPSDWEYPEGVTSMEQIADVLLTR